MFFKNIKSKWRRPVAFGLALAVAAGTVDLRPFLMTSYAYSKDYGICTDNHLYSTAGANCKADEYVMTTQQTKNLTHGSPEWKAAIERNKQVLKEQARANAEASDAVRQFEVKWYLQDEAAKLMVDNGQGENIALKGGTI